MGDVIRLYVQYQVSLDDLHRMIYFQPWKDLADRIFHLPTEIDIVRDYHALIKECEWLINMAKQADEAYARSRQLVEEACEPFTLQEYADWFREALECENNRLSEYDSIRSALLYVFLNSIAGDIDLMSDFEHTCKQLIEEYREKLDDKIRQNSNIIVGGTNGSGEKEEGDK